MRNDGNGQNKTDGRDRDPDNARAEPTPGGGAGSGGGDPPPPENAFEFVQRLERAVRGDVRRALAKTALRHWRKCLGKRIGEAVSCADLRSVLNRLAQDDVFVQEIVDRTFDEFFDSKSNGSKASPRSPRSWLRRVSWRVTLRFGRHAVVNLLGPGNDNAIEPDAQIAIPEVDVREIHRRLVTDAILKEARLPKAQIAAYLPWRNTDIAEDALAEQLGVTRKVLATRLSKARGKIAPVAARVFECSPQLFLVRRPKGSGNRRRKPRT